jgi:hypothetical protein
VSPVPGPVPATVAAAVIFPVLAAGGLLALGADRREHLSYSHCESSLIDWGTGMLPDVPYGRIGGREVHVSRWYSFTSSLQLFPGNLQER